MRPDSSWNIAGPKATQLDWLLMLAKIPGWKAYAWQRAKELDQIETFAGIKDQLLQALEQPNDR